MLMFGYTRRHHRQMAGLEEAGWKLRDCIMWIFSHGFPKSNYFGSPGYGTCLKPAYEIIIMAMKPYEGSFKKNNEKWGQAGLNIDACRLESKAKSFINNSKENKSGVFKLLGAQFFDGSKGRYPANLIFDEETSESLGERARFFYCPKASPSERHKNCGKNTHPTVKPLKLMEYLIKLVMPPQGVLLDPFAGSGSTLLAAKNLGYEAIGIEKEEEYAEIAKQRCT